eukprot:scaffold105378_cov18-Tisochrysis_lutea.AAC.1
MQIKYTSNADLTRWTTAWKESKRSISTDVCWVLCHESEVTCSTLESQVMYTSNADLTAAQRLERGGRSGAVAEVAAFAGAVSCRRKRVLSFFGEKRDSHLQAQEGAEILWREKVRAELVLHCGGGCLCRGSQLQVQEGAELLWQEEVQSERHSMLVDKHVEQYFWCLPQKVFVLECIPEGPDELLCTRANSMEACGEVPGELLCDVCCDPARVRSELAALRSGAVAATSNSMADSVRCVLMCMAVGASVHARCSLGG